jgi:uncharacterized cupin superfamily protein
MKPVINLNELKYENDHHNDFYQGKSASISELIGAQKLGYNLSICSPGKSTCPFHNHHNEEEMFLILEGEALLRYGDKEYPLKPMDIVACPTGGRETAHQIINTGKVDLKYLSLSTKEKVEVCEYPDSDKTGVFIGQKGKRILREIHKSKAVVDYYKDEPKG